MAVIAFVGHDKINVKSLLHMPIDFPRKPVLFLGPALGEGTVKELNRFQARKGMAGRFKPCLTRIMMCKKTDTAKLRCQKKNNIEC